ncbi:MAG: trigger factor [Acidimicrobiaceae bacterium]|nr:trigger factor [Acidimicrobiaceae bacterium]
MRSTAEKSEGNQVDLRIEIDEEELAPFIESSVRKLTKQVRIPGFRPGKAPRKVVESRIGMKAIRLEAIEESLDGFYRQAVLDNDLDVIEPPRVRIDEGEESGNIAVMATVSVRPQVKVEGYDSLVVNLPIHVYGTEEDITLAIERMREQQAETTEVTRPAQVGDQVTVDIEVTQQGEPQEEDSAVDLGFRVGKGEVSADVDEAIVGLGIGESKEFERKPTEGDTEADAEGESGPTSQVKVTLKAVREVILPELNDEFAADVSEFATLAELKDDLKKSFDNMRRAQGRQLYPDYVISAFLEIVEPKTVPDSLVKEEVNSQIHTFGHRLDAQGMSLGQYLDMTGMSQNALLMQFQQGALQSVLLDLALRSLADALAIEISTSDVDEELVRISQSLNEEITETRKRYSTIEAEKSLKAELRKSKAADWLMENAVVLDPDGMPVSFEELKEPTEQETISDPGDEEISDAEPITENSGANLDSDQQA